MPIREGEPIPEATLRVMTAGGVQSLSTADVFGGKRVVLFAVPGAFTPACSDTHLPGYQARATDILATGVDTIACVAVNDAFVMEAWRKARGVGEEIRMLSDGNGDFTRALGLELDARGFGLGTRSRRYAAVVDDGTVTVLAVEPGKGVTVSSAEEILAVLRAGSS